MDFRDLLTFLVMTTVIFSVSCNKAQDESANTDLQQSESVAEQSWLVLTAEDLTAGAHHTRHLEIFGKYVVGFNQGINSAILQGIDSVQSKALDGGGYFVGIRAVPTESPVYYNLNLFGKPLIEIPRQSSYCSGATYSAFIEGMNLLFPEGIEKLSDERHEALRMQEPDGGRREDHIKYWGHWNADGFGNHFALVQYSKMGQVISPEALRPGDFVNISWKSGLGHSVIFLGWVIVDGDKKLVYWSSQTGTNGYGDQVVSLQKIRNIKAVRLTHPENIFTYDVATPVTREVRGDSIAW